MSFWALYNAEGRKDGTVDSWEQDPLHGDAELPMSATDAVGWALEEMDDDATNAVIVSDRTKKIVTWIMNSPAGEPRRWW